MTLTHRLPRLLIILIGLLPCLGRAQTFDTVQIYFDFNISTPLSYAPLDSAIGSLEFRERAAILGYADYVGTGDYNAELSQKRANAVAKYILKNSQKKLQITSIKGNGELPARITDSEDGDSLSRRVDVIIQREAIVKPDPEPRSGQVMAEKLMAGDGLVLEGLNFIGGRHYPLPDSRPVLENLVQAMRENPELRIEILGHICCSYDGKDGYDMDSQDYNLSRNRAQFVYDYLRDNGIEGHRMSFKGLGSSSPLVFPEVTPEDKTANRRVEIKVMKD